MKPTPTIQQALNSIPARYERYRQSKGWRCPKSPTRAHHWTIDAQATGVCRYCHKTKEFPLPELFL